MYTNETTHYSIPKPLGTDLTVPQDYNDAADAVDQALFDASTNATTAAETAASALEAASGAVEEVGSLGSEVNNVKGRVTALEQSDIIQSNKIDALEMQGATKFDSAGIADPYVNGLTYLVGDVVTYNGQRYKCITAVVAAEPFDADKWSAEDVETVLDDIKSDLTTIAPRVLSSVASDGNKTYDTIFATLWAAFNSITDEFQKNNAKLRVVASGGNIKVFDIRIYSSTYASFNCETHSYDNNGVTEVTEYINIGASGNNSKTQSEIFVPISGGSSSMSSVSYKQNQSTKPSSGYSWELITIG